MFVITKDHLPVGITVPYAPYKNDDWAIPLDHPDSIKFRLYDDDDILYMSGNMIVDDYEDGPWAIEPEFEPLDWAMNYAGCTRMDIYNESKKQWEVL